LATPLVGSRPGRDVSGQGLPKAPEVGAPSSPSSPSRQGEEPSVRRKLGEGSPRKAPLRQTTPNGPLLLQELRRHGPALLRRPGSCFHRPAFHVRAKASTGSLDRAGWVAVARRGLLVPSTAAPTCEARSGTPRCEDRLLQGPFA